MALNIELAKKVLNHITENQAAKLFFSYIEDTADILERYIKQAERVS